MNLNDFLLSFIPLFVAIDIIGTAPIYLGLTEQFEKKEKRRLVIQAVITAFALAMIFIATGKVILDFMGITLNDFRIGGGLVLLILSINDLVFASDESRKPQGTIGIVPLGIPLIMGPAALTTILVLVNNNGILPTILSVFINLVIVFFVLYYAEKLVDLIGESGAKAFAKVASLFLAAIAVMMIRVGILEVIKELK
ncbi:MAG: MarC family protein [Ignavibacteria bacterium]|jgi:multiple antibiotic resistance protein|nr:MarC family protein [Ignavibacteria bacterium]MDH7526837.1 MarC family protein [Ignavibacteria bacterium]